MFVFGSISPTTEPNSPAGRRRPGSAPWRVCLTTRCRRCSAHPCSRVPRAAPTPACTRRVRWCTSMCPTEALPHAFPRTPRRRQRVPAAGAPARAVPARRCAGARHQPRRTGFRRPVLGAAPALRLPAVHRPVRGRAAGRPGIVTPWPRPLDVDAMSAASRDLVGLHDFAAFCRHREGATTIRDLQRLDWTQRRRLGHRACHRRRVLLVDGAVTGRRAAGSGGAPPRTRLVRNVVDLDAALERFRRRAHRRA